VATLGAGPAVRAAIGGLAKRACAIAAAAPSRAAAVRRLVLEVDLKKLPSSESGSSFECKLDKKKFKPCRSPKKYKKLKPGKHLFQVRAKHGGQTDPTPAKKKFKVLA
jgi:hypothetical protein